MRAHIDARGKDFHVSVHTPSQPSHARQQCAQQHATTASPRSCRSDCPTRPTASVEVRSNDRRVGVRTARRPRDGPSQTATVQSRSGFRAETRAPGTIATHDRLHTDCLALAVLADRARWHQIMPLFRRDKRFANRSRRLVMPDSFNYSLTRVFHRRNWNR